MRVRTIHLTRRRIKTQRARALTALTAPRLLTALTALRVLASLMTLTPLALPKIFTRCGEDREKKTRRRWDEEKVGQLLPPSSGSDCRFCGVAAWDSLSLG